MTSYSYAEEDRLIRAERADRRANSLHDRARKAAATAALPDLQAAVARRKKRDDVEVLAITGVRPGWVYNWAGGMDDALMFNVEFTFTAGRRQRRTVEVGFRLVPHSDGAEPFLDLTPALLAFLNAAVTYHVPEV